MRSISGGLDALEETAILRARRGLRPNQPDDFATFTSEGMLRNFQQITGGVAAAMIVIAGIALLGIGFGLGAAIFSRAVFDFDAATPLWSVSLGLGVSTAVGLIFGMWPALKAARQDPIEALRYE